MSRELRAAIERLMWESFSAGRRARGGVNRPWKFPPYDATRCAESLHREAFQAWMQLWGDVSAEQLASAYREQTCTCWVETGAGSLLDCPKHKNGTA